MKNASFVLVLFLVLALSSHAELLVNGDFEAFEFDEASKRVSPESWFVFSGLENTNRVTMTRSIALSGRQSIRMRAQQQPQAYQGVFQKADVTEGVQYEFSTQVYVPDADPLRPPVTGHLSIEWLDADGKELLRELSPSWDHTLDRNRWYRFYIRSRAPKDSVAAIFSIVLEDGRIGTGAGSFIVDDASVQSRVSAP